MNADKAVATSPMPLPSGFLLSRLAEVPQMDAPAHTANDAFQAPPQRWLVPGGLQTVMALAWLSFDKSARRDLRISTLVAISRIALWRRAYLYALTANGSRIPEFTNTLWS